MINLKNKNAITLIALVITIVILIILAGVAINLTLGDNGIFRKTITAREDYELAAAREKVELKIAEIQAEKEGKATLEELIEYLKNDIEIEYTVSLTEITASLTGDVTIGDATEIYVVYNKYQFKIDKNLKSQYVSKVDVEIKSSTIINDFDVAITKANGEYLTIDASSATTNDGSQIVQYKYLVNGEQKEATTENTYIVKGLELSTEYQIKVIAVDKDGKTKSSTVKKYTTSDKQYLYNNGDTCDEITGGWKTAAIDSGENYGTVTIPQLTYNSNNMKVSLNSTSGIKCGSLITNNKKYTSYSKLYIKYTASLGAYNSATVIQLQKNYDNIQNYPANFITQLCYKTAITEIAAKEIDIKQITNFDNFYIYFQVSQGISANCNIYEVWLEE